MSAGKSPRLAPAVHAALKAAGLPYRFQLGGKHRKLFVGGQLACVISMGARRFGQGPMDSRTIRDIERAATRARAKEAVDDQV